MKKNFISTLFIISLSAFGQTFTLSGFVTDPANGESQIGVNIFADGSNKSGITNNYGFYSLCLPSENYRIIVSHMGYESLDASLNLKANIPLYFSLKEKTQILEEAVVTANNDKGKVRKAGMWEKYNKAIDSGQANEEQDMHGGVSGYYTIGDAITVKWANAEKSYYDAWSTINFKSSQNMNPFMNPTRIFGDIIGCLGYWSGIGISVRSVGLK